MMAQVYSNNNIALVLQRTTVFALLALLCLSNVFVQGQGSSPAPPSNTATGPAPTGTGGPPATNTATGTASGAPIGTATGTATGPAPSALPSRTPSDPVSSLTMIQPKANMANPPLFPIGITDIQFAWDYDKFLLLPPANLTLEAFTSENPTNIVTIGAAIPGNLKNYTWTAINQKNLTNPIRTGMYTLRIFDGAVGRNGVLPQGGYLSTFAGLRFGLYIPSPYTPGRDMNRKLPFYYYYYYLYLFYTSFILL
ncbi:hypothetical protein BCR41DRAFT_355659 [Lobosporangium transversale]|uniref:DUF7137 domain-containing protein n=1 Tax=Lobosporangium transversale TaxID=64571 RepID=A0A1Y2GLU9_9FUNG|nr:hypothetical protein BCR41DRAFT_355659 [Lobosporangium transversale]ORZ13401.1 hypothetical protein BCR41DRAFT_355659 [Lobosporangium transversale]|eukprot:XP_021880482.1 hypothetical protein BCR41DRAFT_355659 [Lobosporangium transversale]